MPPVGIEKHAPFARFALYLSLGVWSLALFAFCVYRLVYTTRPRSDNTLNNGWAFYEPSIVELLVSSVLGAAFSALMLNNLSFRREHEIFSRNWFELFWLSVLWVLWLGGAAAATSNFSDLNLCIGSLQCRLLQALLAWAWLGWFTLTALLIPTVWIIALTKAFDDNSFALWGDYQPKYNIGLKKLRRPKKTTDSPPSTPGSPAKPTPAAETPGAERGIAGGSPPPSRFRAIFGKFFQTNKASSDTETAATTAEVPGSPEVPAKDSATRGKQKEQESPV